MFCWNCGSKNSDTNKFCGECGRKLARAADTFDNTPPPVRRPTSPPVAHMPERRTPRLTPETTGPQPTPPLPLRDPVAPPRVEPVRTPPTRMERSEPTAPPATFAAPPPTKSVSPVTPANPISEEPRVIHERPVLTTAVKVEQPRTLSSMETVDEPRLKPMVLAPSSERNRIYGPSILGIGGHDERSSDSSAEYLLDDEQPVERSTWRAWALLAVLLVFAFLAYKQFGHGTNVKELFAQAVPSQKAQEPVVSATDSSDSSKGSESASADKKNDPASAPIETAKAEPMQKPENDATAVAHEPDGEKGRDTREEEGKPAQEIENSAPKPSASESKSAPASEKPDVATVELAQKYIQGRGVPQDCNRGFSLLRSAVERPNPRAHIQLGALYASGTCVDQDRAMAYHHFAQAQSLDPRNTWIERNLNALWKEMTPAERQRAERQ